MKMYLLVEDGKIMCEGSSGIVPQDEIKCNFIKCAWGLGLAGMGACNGEPRNHDCPDFIDEKEMLGQWEKESEVTNAQTKL